MTRQIVLDTETTGLYANQGHRITEIGCVELSNRRLTGRTFHTYLNPEREIDPGAVAISGLTYEFLQDKPKFSEIVTDFLTFVLDSEVIIHNAPFDLGFINAELARMNHPTETLDPYIQVIDTLPLARLMHPGQKNNLDALCRRYGVDNSHRTYHGALLDAEILAKVYLQMTAGQSSLALDDAPAEFLGKQPVKQKRIRSRPPNIILKVIRASHEENLLHEARMKELEEK